MCLAPESGYGSEEEHLHVILTPNRCSISFEILQSYDLFLDVAVLINQYSGCIPIWVAFDAEIGLHLAELDVAILLSQFPPNLAQELGLNIGAGRRGEEHEDESFLGSFRDIPRVIRLLDRIHLVVNRC